MGYPASTGCSKINTGKIAIKKVVIATFFLLFSLTLVRAQTTTNPLMGDVTITAAVLVGPGVRPDTPPITPNPGPINTVDLSDVAIFRGLAYPGSTISILKNGIVVAQLPANQDGTFEIRVRNLSEGTYSFGIKAEDNNKLTSKMLLFTIYVSPGIATIVDGVFIPPTITSDKIEVKKGENITFFGNAAPDAEVRLSFYSDTEILKKTRSNASGTWSFKLDSSEFDFGEYNAKARSITTNDLSMYSEAVLFRVGDESRLRAKSGALAGFRKKCDLNDDGRVNLFDFSIMAFWYKRLGFPVKVDLNTDNSVNLTDLSILAYCWTG